jgi:hypothetical protein
MSRSARDPLLTVARLRVREAGVPATVLLPRDLLAWEPAQWALLIDLARRRHLARLARAVADPVKKFVEAYQRARREGGLFPWSPRPPRSPTCLTCYSPEWRLPEARDRGCTAPGSLDTRER